MVLNWFFELEEVFMLQMVSPLILKLSLFLVTAVATHLVMSFGQTFLHYKVAHNPIGGKLFRNHINFHHAHYAEDHLVSRTYLGGEGNITPYFLIPVFLVGGCKARKGDGVGAPEPPRHLNLERNRITVAYRSSI